MHKDKKTTKNTLKMSSYIHTCYLKGNTELQCHKTKSPKYSRPDTGGGISF